MDRFPSRLKRPPLIEAVFEMRFTAAEGRSVELLPGLLFSGLGEAFGKVEPTAAGIIPRQMRQQHPELRHAAQFKLQGTNEALLLGENVLSLNVTPPYPGWARFRERCREVADALRKTGYVATIDRYSLKYVNLLETTASPSLSAFKIRLDLGGHNVSDTGFRLRCETLDDAFLSIVECVSAQAVESNRGRKGGMLFTIDTIREKDAGQFWVDVPAHLDGVHRVLESLFFGLLEATTIEGLGPIWN